MTEGMIDMLTLPNGETFAHEANPTVKVKLDDGALLPVRAHDTDAGADLFCRAGFTLSAHSRTIVRIGVHVELPPYTTGFIKSKSGLNINHDITSEGVIDEGFTGEIMVKLYNHGDKAYHFDAGDKISQLVVLPVLYPTYVRADSIEGGERGDAGYGSTGR